METDKCHFITDIMPIILPVISAIITLIISSVVQFVRDRQSNKQERVMAILNYKVLAYQDIYSALLQYRNYFMLFVDGGNEYKQNEDLERFAPLESNTLMREKYNKNLLFISDDLKNKVEDTLAQGETLNNLGIALCRKDTRGLYLDAVPSSCETVIDKIDECVNLIKQELLIKKF